MKTNLTQYIACVLMLLAVGLAGACGDDSSTSSTPDAAQGSDGSTAPVDGATGADAAPADAATDEPDASTTSCGGIVGSDCGDSAYCNYDDNLCGASNGLGTCESRPDLCQPVERPVCGCDGIVYDNECEAYVAGVDVSAQSGCATPVGTFACGPQFCTQGIEYCEFKPSGVVQQPSMYQCVPFPNGCTGRGDCGCLADEPCGDSCEESDDGDFTLTCPST